MEGREEGGGGGKYPCVVTWLTLVLLSLSDPARSTRFSLERLYSALECVRE